MLTQDTIGERVQASVPRDYSEYRSKEHGWLRELIWQMVTRTGAAVITAATAGYARRVAPWRVHYPTLDMPIRGLHPDLEGLRIAQLTDLHLNSWTPAALLKQVVDKVNDSGCDVVCVTGDLVSDSYEDVRAAAELLSQLRPRVLVSLGNHDYATDAEGGPWAGTGIADKLQEALQAVGATVLRNSSTMIERGAGRICVVGLEDLWSGRFDPGPAVSGLPDDEPIIAMSHNPDTGPLLEPWRPHWILAGHTHGGQIRFPLIGPTLLPVRNRSFDQGLINLGFAQMYVCRGAGSKVPVRFRCPPEVPTFVLRRA